MKINDVITEGPIDAFKRMGAGVAGAVKNLGAPVAGARQAVARSSGQAEINSQVKGMMPYWQKQVQALQTGGVDMADTATYQQQFQDWMTKSGFPGGKDFSVLGALSSTKPGDVQNYLAKAVAMNMSGQAQAKTPVTAATGPAPTQPAPAIRPPAPAPTQPAPAIRQPAPAPTGPAMNNTQIIKSYEMMTPEQRAELIKQLEILNDRDRLTTGTNENLRQGSIKCNI